MPRKQSNSLVWESLRMNNLTYQYYYKKMFEFSISRYKYNGFPDGIDTRYLEISMYVRGGVTLFKEPVIGQFAALPFTDSSTFDMYGNPVQWRAYGVNGYNISLDNTNAVVMYNNLSRMPFMPDIEMFAKRLYKIDRALDTNVNAQRTPVVILCDEDTRLSMKNLMQQYDGNIPFIFGNKGLNIEDVKTLNLNTPFVAESLFILKNQIWNEFLTSVGISNTNFVKKERLISDEVARSMGGVVAARQSGLQSRQIGLDAFNKMFGTNVTVEFNDTIDDYIIDEFGGSVVQNEQIHDADTLDN